MENPVADLLIAFLALTGGAITLYGLGLAFRPDFPGLTRLATDLLRIPRIQAWVYWPLCHFYNVLCLRRKLIITVTLVTIVMATLGTLVLKPLYSSTCIIKVEGDSGGLIDGLSLAPSGTSTSRQPPPQSAPPGYKFGK